MKTETEEKKYKNIFFLQIVQTSLKLILLDRLNTIADHSG